MDRIERKYCNAHLDLKHIVSKRESLNGSVCNMSIHSRSGASSRASSIISGYSPSTIVPSTVIPSEINGGCTRKQMRNKPKIVWDNLITNGSPRAANQNNLTNYSQNLAASLVASTAIASEINGGATRMQMKNNRQQNPAPSIVNSSVVQSEIDGGITRMQMNSRQNRRSFKANNANGNIRGGVDPNFIQQQRPYMPAGYERDVNNFIKYNQ